MAVLEDITSAVIRGKRKEVSALVQSAIDDGVSAQSILHDGLMPGMDVVGDKFSKNEMFVPEMLVAARAMTAGINLLRPLLAEEGVQNIGKACIGTVQGDLHDIGKNLVAMMMESKGIEIIDLGVDVSPEKFVQTAIDEHCDIIACSALLTTTMPVMAEVVKAVEAAGIRDQVTIMVGGAPLSQAYCDEIGADIYTRDATEAANAAAKVLTA
jgi:corrinoid protein of di/trimethylamine methyltransferase